MLISKVLPRELPKRLSETTTDLDNFQEQKIGCPDLEVFLHFLQQSNSGAVYQGRLKLKERKKEKAKEKKKGNLEREQDLTLCKNFHEFTG